MKQEIKAGGNVQAIAGQDNAITSGDVVFQQFWNETGARSTCRNWRTTW